MEPKEGPTGSGGPVPGLRTEADEQGPEALRGVRVERLLQAACVYFRSPHNGVTCHDAHDDLMNAVCDFARHEP